ncbi:MAG: POTRA domain-containing protein, partial [Phycisphaeraceae bacterium]
MDRGREEIRRLYHNDGYFLADAVIDEPTLEETGILIYRVREGPRVRVREINFEGNEVFPEALLRSEIGTRTYLPIIRAGTLSQEKIDQDVASIREYYLRNGYLDVRVGRRIELSDNQRDAAVTFLIDEGVRYTVSEISVAGNEQFSDEQIRHAITLKRGDVFSGDRQRSTHQALRDLYGKLGFIETDVDIARVFDPEQPTVDLRITVDESPRTTVGAVIIRGNPLTQDKVIRRELRGLQPGRPYDATGISLSERRIRETGIIDQATITVMGSPDDEVRDTLVEVVEGQTGSLSFGAAVSSDAGVFGAIDLTQRNFDITDVPESWGEFLTGRAFRGAGQSFSLSLQPGDRFQRYQVSFREPYLFESGFFLDTNAFFFQRRRESWDERRIGGTVGIGRRFGDVWSASLRGRLEQVEIFDVLDRAPVDVFDVEGDSLIDSIGFFVSRSTVDSRFFPTEGTRLTAGIERAGALGGDYEFTKLSADFNAFLAVDEDFFGRKTVLSLRVDTGYILEEDRAPLFERFYAGGHRTFRGFDFRGVGPRGIRADTGVEGTEPVGGRFMFLAGLEYNFPIWEETFRGVFFLDSGTVDSS